ncbi:HAMP domain-containing histidine kinase [Anaerolineae bacterium CFX9]|nr:HAMP domain-containing histidine kinase [Anaerolineae bacterium CFX9]
MYRLLYLLAVVAWIGLTLLFDQMARAANVPLVTVRVVNEILLLWALLGIGLLALGLIRLLRAYLARGRWIRRYSALSGYLNEGILICTSKGRVHWHNEAARDLLGGRKQIAPALKMLLKRAQSTQGIALQTLATGENNRYTVQAVPLDRNTYALIARSLQTGGAQNTFYENFIRRIVHDMRNPLAAVIGHAANMRQSAQIEPDTWRRSISTIEDEAQRLARLVDSMLFDARLAYVPLEIRQHDLADILEEALFAHEERAHQAGKAMEMDVPPSPMPLEGDRDLLTRAFENLIDNSLKYSGADGRLRIRLEPQPNAYLIQFEDNGEGIPPEFLPDRIFEPLVRARSHGSGSGLGLSTVRKIIEMHGGTVSAQSRLNAGTTMTIRLPRPGEMAK